MMEKSKQYFLKEFRVATPFFRKMSTIFEPNLNIFKNPPFQKSILAIISPVLRRSEIARAQGS